MSEMLSAMELPIIAYTSGWMSGSTDIAVQITETSFKNPFGNKGLIGRSIRRDVKIALSLARPSRFLKPPGILPTEYIFSSKSTPRGKKSIPSLGFAASVTFVITTVSPHCTMQEPLACSAYLPISTETVLPPTSVWKMWYLRLPI